MIAQVWENKEFETKKTLRKNPQIDIEIKIENQFPTDSLFFEFFNTLKINKNKSLTTKTLAEKYLKDRDFSLLKSWLNQLKSRPIYSLSKICSLAV